MTAPTLWADHAAASGRTHPIVIGLDTSVTGTGIASSAGWCILRGYNDKKRPFTKLPHADRIAVLVRLASDIINAVGETDLVVLETPAFTRIGGGSHERSWLWWEMYRRVSLAGIPVALMTPQQRMLYATGKGRADKNAVVDAVARRWPAYATGGNDNLADAVVLMAAGMDAFGHALAPVPQAHRKALDAVQWPQIAGAA